MKMWTYPLLQWLDLRDSGVGAFAFFWFFFFHFAGLLICTYVYLQSSLGVNVKTSYNESSSEISINEQTHQDTWTVHGWIWEKISVADDWVNFKGNIEMRLHDYKSRWRWDTKWEDVLCAEAATEVNRSSLSGCSHADLRSVLTEMAFKQSLNGFSRRQGDLKKQSH